MVENLKEKVQKLIALYETQKQRADELELKLRACREKCQSYEAKIEDLKTLNDNLTLGGIFSANTDADESRKRLDKLIREIDNCIRILEA